MRGTHLLQLADLTRNDIEYALNLYESETFHAPTMMHPVETLLSQGFEQTCKTVLELASFSCFTFAILSCFHTGEPH